MLVKNIDSTQYTAETFYINRELSFTIAREKNYMGLVANGGLRFYQYPDIASQEKEALVLAKHMTQKHSIYNTGFSGVKIVANGHVTRENTKLLLDHVGRILNEYNGSIYTGCDININNDDMLYLSSICPYILNAINAPQINTSFATAYGVYGSLSAVMNCVEINKTATKKIIVHGVGKIGSVIAKELLDQGHTVYTYDINSNNANIVGAINISDNDRWYAVECDYLLLCSASNSITEKNVIELNCKWILSSANSPFSGDNIVNILKSKNIQWIPDVVSNAGAVICDSVEFKEPGKYQSINPQVIYDCVYKKIYQKTRQLLELSSFYKLSPHETLDVFLAISDNGVVLPDAA